MEEDELEAARVKAAAGRRDHGGLLAGERLRTRDYLVHRLICLKCPVVLRSRNWSSCETVCLSGTTITCIHSVNAFNSPICVNLSSCIPFNQLYSVNTNQEKEE
jgi:hypothetical protein